MVSIPQIGEICIRSKNNDKKWEWYQDNVFQSPISGKFVSDRGLGLGYPKRTWTSFNPLDRGNCIRWICLMLLTSVFLSFNPLDRGNLYLIQKLTHKLRQKSQSEVSIPQIGEICIRFSAFSIMLLTTGMLFQSPRSEKFVSDEKFMRKRSTKKMFQSPQIGEICIRYHRSQRERCW